MYYVRLGGAESGYIEDFFVFTAPKQEEPEKPETTPKMIGDFDSSWDVDNSDFALMAKCLAGGYDEYEDIEFFVVSLIEDANIDLDNDDFQHLANALAGADSERIWYYADFAYDTETEEYYIYGDLYDELAE